MNATAWNGEVPPAEVRIEKLRVVNQDNVGVLELSLAGKPIEVGERYRITLSVEEVHA